MAFLSYTPRTKCCHFILFSPLSKNLSHLFSSCVPLVYFLCDFSFVILCKLPSLVQSPHLKFFLTSFPIPNHVQSDLFMPLDLLSFVFASDFLSGFFHLFFSVSEVTIFSCLFNSVCNQAASAVSSMASFLNNTPPQPLNTWPCCTGTWPHSYFSFGCCCLYFFLIDMFLCCVKHTASTPSFWPNLLLDCHPHFPHILHWFSPCVLYLSTIKLETSDWSKTSIYFLHATQYCVPDSPQHIMLFVRWLPVLKFLPIYCSKQILSHHDT